MSQSSGKSSNLWLFSGVGVLLVAGVLVLVNYLSSISSTKADFTEYKLHTLTQGTRNILERLDTPIEVRFFATREKGAMPTSLADYAERVKGLLFEYQDAAPDDKLKLEFFDPEPDSDAESAASMNGVRPQMTNIGTQVYLGLSVTMLDKTETIPFLDPSRDELLEYDLSRAIVAVSTNKRPVIGLLTGLPVSGGPQLPPQMQQQQAQPWFIYNELKRDFDVRDLSLTTQEKIDDDIDLLLVIHPNGITEQVEFAIDQYLMKGGKILAFLDPFSLVASQSQQQQQPNPMMPSPGQSSDLAKLLPAWGIEFESKQVVADTTFRTQVGQDEYNPGVLSLTNEAIDDKDVVTNQIRDLLLLFPGAFYGDPKEGLTKDILVHSSAKAMTTDPQQLQFGADRVTVEATGKEYALAVRLTGSFKTAFPDGKPGTEAAKEDEEDPAADKAEEGSAEGEGEKKEEEAKPKDDSLKESQKEGAVILVADSDMLFDRFAVQSHPMFRQIVSYTNGNLPLAQNMVEQLSGDTNLIAVRSRGSTQRPFTTFKEMMEKAEEKQRKTITDFEKKRDEAQQKLNELQRGKADDQRFILSPEQAAEVAKYEKVENESKLKLRDLRKELRSDVTSIENTIKVLNIALVPALVVIAGIVHFLIRRSATSAK